MLKQDYITIKELGEKLDECDINRLINYVDEAVKHMEIINANENDIIRANNIKCDKRTSKYIDENQYNIEVTNEQIDIWKSMNSDDNWRPCSSICYCSFENERELMAKGVILNFILRALKNKEIADVKQIALKNAMGNKTMGKLESKIEEFTARLLIPKAFFSEELGKDIIRLFRNEKNEIIDVEMERNIILAKLQSYGVRDEMARLRLKIASFDGEYNDYTDKDYLSSFTFYYDEMNERKESVKKMRKNEE